MTSQRQKGENLHSRALRNWLQFVFPLLLCRREPTWVKIPFASLRDVSERPAPALSLLAAVALRFSFMMKVFFILVLRESVAAPHLSLSLNQ